MEFIRSGEERRSDPDAEPQQESRPTQICSAINCPAQERGQDRVLSHVPEFSHGEMNLRNG